LRMIAGWDSPIRIFLFQMATPMGCLKTSAGLNLFLKTMLL
jgi:hypothetical protein